MATLIKLIGALVLCSIVAISLVIATAIMGAIAAALAYMTKLCVADCNRRTAEVRAEFSKLAIAAWSWTKKQARAASIQTQRFARRAWAWVCKMAAKVPSVLSTMFNGLVDAMAYTIGSALGRAISTFVGRRVRNRFSFAR